MPSEYMHEIWGGDMVDDAAFANQHELEDFVDLIMRHWNAITHVLHSGDVFLPLLLEDEQSHTPANDWARDSSGAWPYTTRNGSNSLMTNSMVVCWCPFSHWRMNTTPIPYAEPIDAERREQLIVGVAAAVTAIYRYFEPHRRLAARSARESATHRRAMPKTGRNDPCPCGSGKKYKQCCGKVTLH